MIPQSLPRTPTPSTSSLPRHPSESSGPSARDLLDHLNDLTRRGDAAGIRALLMRHPQAFGTDLAGEWRITPANGIDLQSLFSALPPDIDLPALRLEGFRWGEQQHAAAALCHPGLRSLTLHECFFTQEAWNAAADQGRKTFASHPARLQRLVFTFDLPERDAVSHTHLVSSACMAGWTRQLHRLDDLTLSGFQGHDLNYHMSYSDVLHGLDPGQLRRLVLQGFMAPSLSSGRMLTALQRLAGPGAPPLHLSLRGWRWLTSPNDRAQSLGDPVNAAVEKGIGEWLRTASSHLTLELDDMGDAGRICWPALLAVGQREADVSLRLNCPEDAIRQHDVPFHVRGVDLSLLTDRRNANLSALKGLHVQVNDASAFDGDVIAVLSRCQRLQALTIAIRAAPSGIRGYASSIDQRMGAAVERLPELHSLELRSDFELTWLPQVQARLAARGQPRV